MSKSNLTRTLTDIRFWIILLFLTRLFGITDPPLEPGHNYRQALTNMIARNFLEVSPNILYPRIDIVGEKSGIIGSEFPVYNYMIYLLAKLFGYDHWFGRLINLIISSISLLYFFTMIRRYFSQNVAFNATIILAVSIWFSFSRKIMPDVFSVSLIIISLFYGLNYLSEGKSWRLILFFVFSTLGALSKIPSITLFGVLIIPFLGAFSIKRKSGLVISLTITMMLTGIWYFYWVPYLVETYHFKLFFPKGLSEGWNEIMKYPFDTLDKFLFTSFYSFIAFAVFLFGIIYMIHKKEMRVIYVFAITSIIFFVFILKTGSVFSFHNYYIIPYVPVMALIAATGLSSLKIKWQYIVLALIGLEAIANQSYDFMIKENQTYKLILEQSIEDKINKNDLVVVNGSNNPQTMYFLHRKGWTVENEDLNNERYIENLRKSGAKFLIIDKHRLSRQFSFPLVYRNQHIDVYDLDP